MAPVILSAEEKELFELLNVERLRYGFQALALDQKLGEAARLKAKDMVENGYFGHVSPSLGSPAELLKQTGITNFTCLGAENLAQAPTALKAHRSLAASAVHLANMLNPRFSHVGIASAAGGRYGRVWIQLFGGQSSAGTLAQFQQMAAVVAHLAPKG